MTNTSYFAKTAKLINIDRHRNTLKHVLPEKLHQVSVHIIRQLRSTLMYCNICETGTVRTPQETYRYMSAGLFDRAALVGNLYTYWKVERTILSVLLFFFGRGPISKTGSRGLTYFAIDFRFLSRR